MMGMSNKASKDNMRVAEPKSVEHLELRIHILEARVAELSQENSELMEQNDDFEAEIARLEQAKADTQVRHAMRVSDLEHRLMIMKQQLWVTSSPEGEVTNDGPPQTAASAASAAATARMSLPAKINTTPSMSRSMSPQSSASLDAERARRGELESQVAVLRTQLNEERRRLATRDKEHREQAAQLNRLLMSRDGAVAFKDAELRRVTALMADQTTMSQQRTSRLKQQLAEAATARQQDTDAHAAQLAERMRGAETMRLQKNEQMAQRAAAERNVQQLQLEVARRGEQLEYYQQRLVRTAEFRLVKTPFETEAEVETVEVPREAEVAGVATAVVAEVVST